MSRLANLYISAKAFLLQHIPSANATSILDGYLALPDKTKQVVEVDELFRRLLESAQDSNMKAGVIGGAIGGVDRLGNVLFGFDPFEVKNKYFGDPEGLLSDIVGTLNPRGKVRTVSRGIWPRYCRTIISAAVFLAQFKSAEEFYDWANHLYKDKRSMAALPLILAEEIEGIGYTLACDFLKELGFVNYGKPDVQVMDIFIGLGLCEKNSNPYNVQKIIAQIAGEAGVSSYNVDKLFWLVGSGKFYRNPELGKNGRIGSKKKQFLSQLLEQNGHTSLNTNSDVNARPASIT